jgi:hypothetical protein
MRGSRVLRVSLSQICTQLSSPHTYHMSCQSHSPALDHHNNIWPGVQTLLITRFSQLRVSSSRLCQTPFSAPHPRTPSVHHQVSHPYQTTGNITVLYMLVFMPSNNQPSAASDSGTVCWNVTRSASPRLYQTKPSHNAAVYPSNWIFQTSVNLVFVKSAVDEPQHC